MDASKTKQFLYREENNVYTLENKDKFELVKCSLKGLYCKDILPEINKLYAAAELARVNKDYHKSAELLQTAYVKTLILKESGCTRCAEFFQTSITKTMEDMQEEVYDLSAGFFQKKYYQKLYLKLCYFLKKMELLNIGEACGFLTKQTSDLRANAV